MKAVTKSPTVQGGVVIQAALCSIVKSKCTASNGKIIFPLSSWSRTPDLSSVSTSRCTALKSRSSNRDSSRMDMAPAPVILLTMARRVGASITFTSDSISGKDIINGMSAISPLIVAAKEPFICSQDSLCDKTRTINVFIGLPPELFYVGHELIEQIIRVCKSGRKFLISDVFVVAFSCFIIVPHYANQISISEGSLVLSQSRSAALSLNSQPSPVAMKASSTEVENSIVMAIFPSSVLAIAGIINQAADSLMMSRCTSLNGITTPLSVRSTTPTSIRPTISACTALKSRPTRLDTSRMVISPSPAIASAICILFGDSIFQSNSALGNVMDSPLYSVDENPVSRDSFIARSGSLRSTLMVNVRMMLPPAVIQHVSFKVLTQLVNVDESGGDFSTPNVFMVAFSCFVIVANEAGSIFNVSETVLIIMQAGPDRRVDKPDNNFNKASVRKVFFISGNQFSAHDGKYYITPLVMSKNPSPIDHLHSGRYSVLAATLLVAGIGTPEFTEAHDRALAVFLCAEHCHIRIMVGRAGQPSGWPGSSVTGSSNPVRLTTLELGTSGGEFSELTEEAAIMATIPTPLRFTFIFKATRRIDGTICFLHAKANTERQARKIHEKFYELELLIRHSNKRPRNVRTFGEVAA